MWSCQSKCPVYSKLPSTCRLVTKPGKCCQEPQCDFNNQYGSFTGTGSISGQGVGATPTSPPPCADNVTNCNMYQLDMCTSVDYRDFAKANCAKFCNLCTLLNQPKATDRCIYKGIPHKQGETWYDACDYECICENAAYGYYRCNKRCPSYTNL